MVGDAYDCRAEQEVLDLACARGAEDDDASVFGGLEQGGGGGPGTDEALHLEAGVVGANELGDVGEDLLTVLLELFDHLGLDQDSSFAVEDPFAGRE